MSDTSGTHSKQLGINLVNDSTMTLYFFCCHCGIPTEVLPEDYVFPPTSECSQCQGLKNEGWLEEAKVRLRVE